MDFEKVSAGEARQVLRDELTLKCAHVLQDAGVYKQDERGDAGVLRFLKSIGYDKA